MAKRKAKCGIYNMGWTRWEDTINLGVEAEKASHGVQFFTDQMNGYLFRKEGEAIFGQEKMKPGPLANIPNYGTMAIPRGIMGQCDPVVAMPVIGDKTQNIELFLGAVDAVRHAPAKLAQTFISLGHATQGRAFFALGGSEIKQLTAYGFSRIGSAQKLKESIQIIRQIFESGGEPIYFEGEHWKMNGGALEMEPYNGQFPRVLLAPGAGNEIMGRYSDGMLTNTVRHPGGVEAFARDVQDMREAAEKEGRDPNNLRVAAAVQVLLHDDPDELNRLADTPILKYQTMLTGRERGEQWREHGFEHPLGEEFGYARKQRPEKMEAAVIKEAISKVPYEAVKKLGFHAGSVDDVAETLQGFVDAGLDYLGIVDYATWADPSQEMSDIAAENLKRLIGKLQG